MKFSKYTKYDILWSKMTLTVIINTKTSKSPGKSKEVGGGLQYGNKVSQNTVKNTLKMTWIRFVI